MPWTIFFAALLIGLPLFFEVGFVLLAPLAFAVARRVNVPIVLVGLPMLAGLSIAHGLVPPHPAPTLAAATFHALYALGLKQGRSLGNLKGLLGRSLEPIAAVVLIVGAGGGFKQMLLAIKIGDLIGRAATQAHLSPLFLAWLAAALVRVATGSATVATITGAGITAPLLASGSHVSPELMVLATGAGSLILSHVNDAGFWLVKEYFGLSLIDTLKSWTVMETLLSIFGLFAVLALSTVVHG